MQIYKQNMLQQRFFFLDVTNLVLSIALIAVTALALLGEGGMIMHSLVFLLAGIVMLLNTIKNICRKSLLAVSFAIFTVVMFGIYGYILYVLIGAG
ncbi:MAG: hypothetical protein J5518_02970 [Lachnospiraceae bacterium]|nr:hypothetical protein [Lachnospiraceae bacterium]